MIILTVFRLNVSVTQCLSYLRFFHQGVGSFAISRDCETLTALITSCHSRQTWHTGPTHLLSFFNGNKECWLLFGTFTKWLGRTSCNIQVPDPAGARAGSGLAECCHLPPRHRHPLVDNMWVNGSYIWSPDHTHLQTCMLCLTVFWIKMTLLNRNKLKFGLFSTMVLRL